MIRWNGLDEEELSMEVVLSPCKRKSSTSTNTRRRNRASDVERKVSFSSVEIRQYNRILDDNPACTSGPGISIGWEYNSSFTRNIDLSEYERLRKPYRVKYVLPLPRRLREYILLDLGYTKEDIAESVRRINKIKFNRTQTVNNLHVAKMEEVMEIAKNKFGGWLGRHKKHHGHGQ